MGYVQFRSPFAILGTSAALIGVGLAIFALFRAAMRKHVAGWMLVAALCAGVAGGSACLAGYVRGYTGLAANLRRSRAFFAPQLQSAYARAMRRAVIIESRHDARLGGVGAATCVVLATVAWLVARKRIGSADPKGWVVAALAFTALVPAIGPQLVRIPEAEIPLNDARWPFLRAVDDARRTVAGHTPPSEYDCRNFEGNLSARRSGSTVPVQFARDLRGELPDLDVLAEACVVRRIIVAQRYTRGGTRNTAFGDRRVPNQQEQRLRWLRESPLIVNPQILQRVDDALAHPPPSSPDDLIELPHRRN